MKTLNLLVWLISFSAFAEKPMKQVEYYDDLKLFYTYEYSEPGTECEIWSRNSYKEEKIRVCLSRFDGPLKDRQSAEVSLGAVGGGYTNSHRFGFQETNDNQADHGINTAIALDVSTRLDFRNLRSFQRIRAGGQLGSRISKHNFSDQGVTTDFKFKERRLLTIFFEASMGWKIVAVGAPCQLLGGFKAGFRVSDSNHSGRRGLGNTLMLAPGPELSFQCRSKNQKRDFRLSTSSHFGAVQMSRNSREGAEAFSEGGQLLTRAWLQEVRLEFETPWIDNRTSIFGGVAVTGKGNQQEYGDQVGSRVPVVFMQNDIALRIHSPLQFNGGPLDIRPILRYFGGYMLNPAEGRLDSNHHTLLFGVRFSR
ncbi:MAG: hypothetical protein CL678_10050 [Bdellovibrionaceae bacterium]|nr:hypothetical protein [Pseudobdellovibrionaceae bacterium]|tara:strand:- start:31 stop:1128 length:1098 start_codon:yes stop_codon:yes gene_type:complete